MNSHAEEVLTRVREGAGQALEEMGRTAVDLVRAQMRTGYGPPIRQSGALEADVRWQRDGEGVNVGNTLPYAAVIHNGSRTVRARPYLRDALTGGSQRLARVAEETIAAQVR